MTGYAKQDITQGRVYLVTRSGRGTVIKEQAGDKLGFAKDINFPGEIAVLVALR